jgi:hypothetical protein
LKTLICIVSETYNGTGLAVVGALKTLICIVSEDTHMYSIRVSETTVTPTTANPVPPN